MSGSIAVPDSPRSSVRANLPRNIVVSRVQHAVTRGENNNDNMQPQPTPPLTRLTVTDAPAKKPIKNSAATAHTQNFDDRFFWCCKSSSAGAETPKQKAKRRKLCVFLVCITMLLFAIAIAVFAALISLASGGRSSSDSLLMVPAAWTLPECHDREQQPSRKCPAFEMGNATMPIHENETEIALDGSWYGIRPIQYSIAMSIPNLKRNTAKYAPSLDYRNNMSFSGTVTLIFKTTLATDTIVMHRSPNALTIRSVSVQTLCGTRTYCVKKVDLEVKGDRFRIDLDEKLTAGEIYSVKVDYDATRYGQKAGIYVGQTKTSLGLSTIFQMRYARLVFPCIDHPALKTVFNLCVKHQPRQRAMGNSPVRSRETVPDSDDLVETCFDPTVPLPTYVFTFSLLGNYAEHNTSSYPNATREDLPNVGVYYTVDVNGDKFNWIHDEAVANIEKMTEITKMPFPMPKMDFLVQPTPFWGIENMGLIALDTYHFRHKQYPLAHQILTHEVIHQWLGNIFTVSTWSEICLQEGLTAYLEWMITAEFGIEDLKTVLETKMNDAMRAEKKSHPIIRPFDLTQQIADDCFTKPPLIFHMLREAFGADLLFTFMSRMAHKYKYGHAGLQQWKEMMYEITNDQRASAMLDIWFTQPGYPLITVSRDSNGLRVKQQIAIKYSQLHDLHNSSYEAFPIPLTYIDSNNNEWSGIMDSAEMTIPVLDHGSYLVLDVNNTAYARFAYTADNYRGILESCVEKKAGKCMMNLHQVNYLFDDFCLGLTTSLLPLDADVSTGDVWTQLFAVIRQYSVRGTPEHLLSLSSTCLCCVKSPQEINDEPPSRPWAQGCRYSWNDICRKTKLMQFLNRTQEIEEAARGKRII